MMRIFIIILLAAAIWYGWKQYPKMAERRPAHEAVIENQTGAEIERVRLKIGDQTLVKESIANGERVVIPFRVNQDATFSLVWNTRNGESNWSGGMVPAGPMVQRHEFVIDADGQVMYRAENK
jgi:hypothetical protein